MPRLAHAFASDNYAGVHPSVMEAIQAANAGHEIAYGEDSVTEELSQLIASEFGEGAQCFPVFNGTGANVIALSSLCRRWESVICAESAHVACDEGGAPEKVAGLKLHTVPTPDGKLTPAHLASQLFDRDSVHRSQPAAVTITQTTELGTVYSVEEVRALCAAAHEAGLVVHMDGARLSNAAAALGLPFKAFTTDAGVDILSFGGTKAGAMAAEAVVVLPGPHAATLAAALPFLRKTTMQLASKQRFISAQLCALLRGGLSRALAANANAMAEVLEGGLRGRGNIALPQPRQANAVFPVLSQALADALGAKFRFYVWNTNTYAPRVQVRWMCSWDTRVEAVEELLRGVEEESAKLGE
jgi:threonine aldolase